MTDEKEVSNAELKRMIFEARKDVGEFQGEIRGLVAAINGRVRLCEVNIATLTASKADLNRVGQLERIVSSRDWISSIATAVITSVLTAIAVGALMLVR